MLGNKISNEFIKGVVAIMEITVEIAEMIQGYWQVRINDLPIVNYPDKEDAERLVKHFIAINPDKNIKEI
ncbi:hypothetical protein KM915_21025 [Cytobacillus oceanisediminis]|nr:hypothetical protein [Cytobacillus oceanisediminis]